MRYLNAKKKKKKKTGEKGGDLEVMAALYEGLHAVSS
jgi:hypothetical protein